MLRAILTMVLVLALNLISGGDPAAAFTVRFGPVPVAEGPETVDSDVPTPRLLNLAIGSNGVTFGPAQPAPEPAPRVPAVRVRSSAPTRTSGESPRPIAHSQTHPRQLQGVELMLLRHTKQVAKR